MLWAASDQFRFNLKIRKLEKSEIRKLGNWTNSANLSQGWLLAARFINCPRCFHF